MFTETIVVDLPEISEVFYDSQSLQFHSVKGVGISYDKNQFYRFGDCSDSHLLKGLLWRTSILQ